MENVAGQAAWQEWAERELGAHPDRQAAAVEAAIRTLHAGLSPTAAVVAAWLETGAPVPAADLTTLWDELRTYDRITTELAAVEPGGDLTAAGLAHLSSLFSSRLEAAREIYSSALPSLGEQISSLPSVGAPAKLAPRPPGPSLREFFSDNSILLISVAGAFLLIVSTLLFEMYGTTQLGSEVRFGGVLALNLVFGVAGYLCFGRPPLRLVGQTYLAIFALMAPLTIAAAWVFLALESRGITSTLALGLGGLGCAGLYAILATRLGSRAYAALSMAALEVGSAGLLASWTSSTWTAPALGALTAVFVAIAYPPAGMARRISPFTRPAEAFIHGAAVVALAWSGIQGLSELVGGTPPPSLQFAATCSVLAGAYALYAWRSRRTWMLWTVWLASSLGVLSSVDPLQWGERGYVICFVLLAWAYAAGSRWMPGAGIRAFVRIGACVQAAIPVLLNASPDWLMAGALIALAGIGVLFAVEDRRPVWLLLALGIFTPGWFWIVKTLVPPPPHATFDALVMVYSPLAAAYGLAGIAHVLGHRPRWSWPLYVAAAAVGFAVAVAAIPNDLLLAGRALAVYAVIAYAVAWLHRLRVAAVTALVAGTGAVLLLLAAGSVAVFWCPLAVGALACAFYLPSRVWAGSPLGSVHRYGALALACLDSLATFGVPDFAVSGSAASLAALATSTATAAMLLVDGRIHRRSLSDYLAALVASVGGFWIARYAAIDNLDAYIALTGAALVAAGLVAAHDSRRPAPLGVCRISVAAGGTILAGASAYLSFTDDHSFYTVVLVLEALAALGLGIGTRSRTLVLVGAAALAVGALRALFLILESVQVYIVFGVIAMLLLVGAGVLAAIRDRLSAARSAVAQSWASWV